MTFNWSVLWILKLFSANYMLWFRMIIHEILLSMLFIAKSSLPFSEKVITRLIIVISTDNDKGVNRAQALSQGSLISCYLITTTALWCWHLPVSQIGNRGTEEPSRWTQVTVLVLGDPGVKNSHFNARAFVLTNWERHNIQPLVCK